MEVSRRSGAASKPLELTPLWESVQRYSRLPESTDLTGLFAELAGRLAAPEWEVRQHGLRVLADVLPVVPAQLLDGLMIPTVLTEVALNLGHSAPAVRQSAMNVLLSYLDNTTDPEFVLRSVVTVGLDSPTANPTFATNVISYLPRLIDNTLNRGESISHQSLVHLVTSISKKLAHMSTQQDALDTLTKIRDHVGENRFDHFLESYYPEVKRDLDVLYKVYQVNNVRDSGIDLQSMDSKDSSTSQRETPTSPRIEVHEVTDDISEEVADAGGGEAEAVDDGSKVLVQEEISFDEGSLTMTVVEEPAEEEKKTPRRVTFGGEVVKVRTPDSDATIENQESMDRGNSLDSMLDGDEAEHENEDKNAERKDEAMLLRPPSSKKKPEMAAFSVLHSLDSVEEKHKAMKRSGIPLPVMPALHMPHARRTRIVMKDVIPSWDGGESLTSSSEGEQDMARLKEATELSNLNFLPPEIQKLLNNKDDPRSVIVGLESLPELRLTPREWFSLTSWLTSRLSEPRPARLLTATLRALTRTLPRLQARSLQPILPWLVPAIARRLSSVPLPAKLEAALALQALMRQVGPAQVVKVLLSEKGLSARSSKLRENSLLGLLYGLMTYPSSEFDTSLMAEKVMAMAPAEPKRRVRQAVLETLAVLAQFVPRNKLVLSPERLAAPGGADFSEALAARLSRRLLPAVSSEGLVLYALHIPPMNELSEYFVENIENKEESDKQKLNFGRDVDWILSGSGSLSSGSARSRSQMDLAQRDLYTSRDAFSNWSKDDMMAVGTALPPRSFTFSHSPGEDRYYDQVWAAEPHRGILLSSSQSSTRPLYLRYQNGQSDLQRGNVPEQGFPQLSSSYSSGLNSLRRGGGDLSQTWSGPRWGESPPHVSINQSLPPIAHGVTSDWRQASRWQPVPSQIDLGQRIVLQDDQRRVGRWSRRQDLPPYHSRIVTPNTRSIIENGLRSSPVVSRSESSLVAGLDNGVLSSQPELAHSSPSLVPQNSEPVLSRQGTPRSSPSILSILGSQPHLENGIAGDGNDVPDEGQLKAVEALEGVAEVLEILPRSPAAKSPLPSSSPVPKSPVSRAAPLQEQMTIDDIEEIDENANPADPDNDTPETKSLGTPSSEFGSESSKTTDTSGNTVESNNNPEEKPRRRAIPRPIGLRSRLKNTSKERPPLFPPTLPPFENPKDAFLKTILQLENPEWEVVMQGLQGLVRLCRHHTKLLTASVHSVVTALVHNIKNLRSQVSRGSCQASKEIFDSIGRFLDSEVEDLSAALLSRTADTNKFLRGDALCALESMVDHSNPVRSIGILTNKGAKHQNALVRSATAHLLLRLTKRLGAERCLSLPKESRDQLILTSANLLTEGSLDTRRYAKEIFTQLNNDSRLFNVMSEVVPNNILRNINKVLSKIAITKKK